MKTVIWISAILTIIPLAGYFGLTKLSNERPSNAAGRQVLNPKFQDIRIAGHVLKVEIANTPPARQQGLSDRPALDQNQGLLFIFDEPGLYSFWMKDMNFPLDIIWFDEKQKIVDLVLNAAPEEAIPQKVYQPSNQAQYALEVAAGFAEKYNLKSGDEFIFLSK